MPDEPRNYPQTSVWSVVGNIIGERACGVDRAEVRAGTRLFRPNAKVYLCGVQSYWAVLQPDRRESIIVLGQHRKSRDWIVSYVRSTYVQRWRIRVAYDPAVVSRMKQELWCAFECSFDWTGDRTTPEAVETLFAAWGLPKYESLTAERLSGVQSQEGDTSPQASS
jgi:hypothetical protein